MVAGVTEALVPVAAPYQATGQIDGLLAGQAATVVVNGSEADQPSATPLALVTWLLAALLFAGNIIFLLTALIGSRRTART
jgi:hypothetical protein